VRGTPEPTGELVSVEAWDPLHQGGAPDLHWSSDNIGEGLPGVLTPLGWSLWRYPVDHAGRVAAYRVGVLTGKERGVPAPDRLMVQSFYGRAGMQTEFYALIGDRMPGTTGADAVRGILGRVPEDLVFHPTKRRYPVVAWRLPWTFGTAPRQARALTAATDAWWRETIPLLPRMDERTALATFHDAARRFADNLTTQGVITFAVVSPLYEAVAKLVERTGVGDIASLSGSGGAEMAIITDIWRASRGEIDVEQVIANHGFHGPKEGEISSRVWREDPTPLQQMIKDYAERADTDNPVLRQAEARRRLPALQREVAATFPAPLRPLIRRLLRLAATGIPLRGLSKRAFGQSTDVARGAARRLGEHWAAAGTIDHPDDVFMLTVDELARPLPDEVKNLVARRRERRQLYQRIAIPEMWKGMPSPITDDAGTHTENLISGIGVSAGVVAGRVRVVTDPSFDEVEPDEVLVAPTTDPSWSSIMFISSALVVDIGGALSHAAVVARELGIPCVVNTRTGTRALRTGDRVRVDGSTGTVEILHRASQATARTDDGIT
jgi:pyruvate,water dikinase